MRWLIAKLFGNFGVVEKNKIYRSAQAWHIYPIWLFLGLKTVLNLSHKPEKDIDDRFEQWYCKLLGIKYIHWPTIGPGPSLDDAFEKLKECEKPVLLHCEGGKDRSGGLVAIYKREVLERCYYEIITDWATYSPPGDDWLQFLFKRWD